MLGVRFLEVHENGAQHLHILHVRSELMSYPNTIRGPLIIKKMLNSADHEFFPAHKFQSADNPVHNVEMPTIIGISAFMNR